MAEAKRRNPDIVLLGLVYAWPSWVNPSGNNPWQSTSTEQNAADYMARWVSGCKSAHNLTIDCEPPAFLSASSCANSSSFRLF